MTKGQLIFSIISVTLLFCTRSSAGGGSCAAEEKAAPVIRYNRLRFRDRWCLGVPGALFELRQMPGAQFCETEFLGSMRNTTCLKLGACTMPRSSFRGALFLRQGSSLEPYMVAYHCDLSRCDLSGVRFVECNDLNDLFTCEGYNSVRYPDGKIAHYNHLALALRCVGCDLSGATFEGAQGITDDDVINAIQSPPNAEELSRLHAYQIATGQVLVGHNNNITLPSGRIWSASRCMRAMSALLDDSSTSVGSINGEESGDMPLTERTSRVSSVSDGYQFCKD